MYGSPAGVASLTKQWTENGEFTDVCLLDCLHDEVTNPTITEVETWLMQFSSSMDVALDGKGFVTPISAPQKVVDMLTMIVEQYVADMVKYANNSGRFATDRAREWGLEPMTQIFKDINNWVNTNAGAIEAAGAARTDPQPGGQIITKTNKPMFTRKLFDKD